MVGYVLHSNPTSGNIYIYIVLEQLHPRLVSYHTPQLPAGAAFEETSETYTSSVFCEHYAVRRPARDDAAITLFLFEHVTYFKNKQRRVGGGRKAQYF